MDAAICDRDIDPKAATTLLLRLAIITSRLFHETDDELIDRLRRIQKLETDAARKRLH